MLNPEMLKPFIDQYKGVVIQFLLKYVADHKDEIHLEYFEEDNTLKLKLDVDRSLFTDNAAYNEIIDLLSKAKS